MKKNTIILLSLIMAFATIAAPTLIGSSFSYQGQLHDNGAPANGLYDVKIDAYRESTGNPVLATQEFTEVEVSNGLFTIDEVDFGDMIYNGEAAWLEVSVKIAGDPTYTPLDPRQRISAVPYAVQADYLGPIGADNGDILTFNSGNWEPSAPEVNNDQWDQSGSTLTNLGKVGVGEATPSAQLHVTNTNSQISLLKLDDVSDTRMVVQATGKVGIGNTNPSDRLMVQSDVGEHALRVVVGTSSKLRVLSNGGTTIGLNNTTTTPENGLYVHGDAKQSENSNGMLKYMASINCGNPTTISNQYVGVSNTGVIQATTSAATGRCTLDFPTDVSGRYFHASAVTTSGDSIVGCNFTVGAADRITCTRSKNGVDSNGPIMLFIY